MFLFHFKPKEIITLQSFLYALHSSLFTSFEEKVLVRFGEQLLFNMAAFKRRSEDTIFSIFLACM